MYTKDLSLFIQCESGTVRREDDGDDGHWAHRRAAEV